jgi:hypothetical protein
MAAALSDAERATLGAMWAFRARGEDETAAHYEDVSRRMRAEGVDLELVERVVAASADERRHRDLCADMAARLQHPPLRFSTLKLPRIAPHSLDGGARLAYEMVALFCVTESINATLLLRSWQQAKQEATRHALHTLLADEVEHSRIGWGYLSSQRRWHDELAAGLPLMLAAATHDDALTADRDLAASQLRCDVPTRFLAERSPSAESAALVAHGMLGLGALRAIFLEAMHDVVLPGLELCGIATEPARRWLATCTGRWQTD